MQARVELRQIFEQSLDRFLKSTVMQRIVNGQFDVRHYRSVLREIYFYSREDPQIQAFATAFFKGDDRALVRLFLKHAVSEIGHEQLALTDLTVLGADTSTITTEYPIPTTVALTSFPYWATQFLNPVAYLGYLYFLEGLPTSAGDSLMASLEGVGVPRDAMTFLQEHATVDVAHIRLMDTYVEKLVRSDRDLLDVAFALRTTAKLYEGMIAGAFENVENVDNGSINIGEVSRLTAPELIAAA